MRYDQIQQFKSGAADDDLCPCGRLKRFKNCCKGVDKPALLERIQALTLFDRSKLTVEAVRYFLFRNSSVDPYASQSFTPDRVSQFYRYISDLWPRLLDGIDSLQGVNDSRQLSGFYVGDPRPETIIHNTARLALYVDRIFIPQPFYMAWSLREEYDPVAHPEQVMQDTRKWAIVTLLLQPWIESGLIVFVPSPDDFDQDLRDAFLASGKRREAEGRIYVDPEDLAQLEQFFKADWLRQFYSLSDDEIITRLRHNVGLSDDKIPGMLAYVHEKRSRDPLYVPGVAKSNPLMRIQIPTIEETLLTCGLTGAFPFTDQRGKWREITENIGTLPADSEVWSPLTRAFNDCQLEFLNVEDTRLAFAIRADGYLASFRSFLRSLWKSIDGRPDEVAVPSLARDMADRLRDEHKVAGNEWKAIHTRYDAAIRASATTAAFAGVGSALTQLGLIGVAFSFASHLVFSAGEGRKLRADIANFRATVPMSIFVDLMN